MATFLNSLWLVPEFNEKVELVSVLHTVDRTSLLQCSLGVPRAGGEVKAGIVAYKLVPEAYRQLT